MVEDRNDPSKLGRVKVRSGFHTEDKRDTNRNFGSHIMHPVTDPSMQGMGSTPSFLVEGSWVVGFFRDADENNNQSLWEVYQVSSRSFQYKYSFNDPKVLSSKKILYLDMNSMNQMSIDLQELIKINHHYTREKDSCSKRY